MALGFKYSTGFKNAVCATGSVRDTFSGGFIKLYASSTEPASADDALPVDKVLLLTYSVNSGGTGLTLAAEADAGGISKPTTDVWSGVGVASGTARFFRFEKSGDTGTDSESAVRVQGSVGSGASDFVMANTAIAVGQTYVLDYFVLTFA